MAVATAIRVRPLGDAVIVRSTEPKEEIRSGLIIPDTAKEKSNEGEIVAAGKGKTTEDGKLLPMNVKVGDKVLYRKYSATEVKIDGQEYLIMHQDDIIGIIEG